MPFATSRDSLSGSELDREFILPSPESQCLFVCRIAGFTAYANSSKARTELIDKHCLHACKSSRGYGLALWAAHNVNPYELYE